MEENKEYIIRSTKDSFEINLKPVWDFFRKKLKSVIYITSGFLVLGIIVSILTPDKYSSSINLLLESNNQNIKQRTGILQNLSFFGVNQNASSNTFGPDIYPDVVKSTPFLLEVLNKKVFFSRYDSTISFHDFFEKVQKPSALDFLKNYTIGLPSRFIGLFEGKNPNYNLPVSLNLQDTMYVNGVKDSTMVQPPVFRPLNISRKDLSYIDQLNSLIKIDVSDNYVTITTQMPDPMASAELTNIVYEELSKYIIFYRTRKSTIDMNFIQERTDEARTAFYKAQIALADFRDENRNINTAALQAEEQRLQAEFDLNFNLYKSLSQQLENAKIKVKENTPVFDVLEPVHFPIERSEPKRFKIVFIYTLAGAFLGFG